MAEAALRAAAAIEQVMPARLRRRVQALLATTVPLTARDAAIPPSVLALLALACRDGERLRFGYVDRVGQDSGRHVEPYRLVCTGRRWYLVAHDLDRQDWRSFRVDRMHDPLPTGRHSTPPDPPDAARFVSDAVSRAPYRWQVRVVMDAPADVVAGLVPPTVAVIEPIDDERCLLVSGADSLDGIVLHLAMLDIPFTALEPPELREHCATLARRLHRAARATR
jgi:predicted DNA-binding transcriptional regulator YafY